NFIITHRGIRSLSKLLKYNALSNYFEEIITREDEFLKKPDPQSFLYKINKYKLSKEKVLAIGDRELDIKAAHAANIKSCFFDPKGKTHELADFNIKGLSELERIL
ncbi:MAG: HAD-IA family hydrolase, partial [Candidatus Lokiarchaeota archaeon]